MKVMELQFGVLVYIRYCALLSTTEVGKEAAGCPTCNKVGASTSEQHCRLARGVGSSQDGDGILERNPKIPYAAQFSDTNFRQSILAIAVVRAQSVPHIAEFPINQRHFDSLCDWLKQDSRHSWDGLRPMFSIAK